MEENKISRRKFITAAGTTGAAALAGCNGGSNENGTSTETSGDNGQQTHENPEDAVRYFFDDQTGALGHLGDENIPENADTITNNTTESEYQEMQTNDRAYAEDAASSQTAPQGTGLDMTVDQMINRAEEIYNNPTQHIETSSYPDLDLTQEDDEIVFTRALIKASQEAGVDSSGLADIVAANIAEDAVQQIQPGFTNFKLSTIDATEPISPNSTGANGGAERTNEYNQTFVNSGFVHLPGMLQYEKNGEVEVKYAELTDATNEDSFRRAIRDPEFSAYRSSLDQDTISVARNSEPGEAGNSFPEHYVTAFDYEKARELESQGVLAMGDNGEGGIVALGDKIGSTLLQMVDDMGITGYDNNPDRNLPKAMTLTDGTLVSDSFGESIEEYILDPDIETRDYMENVGRALYEIHEQEGWETSVAIEGTLENPVIIPTTQDTVNQVRQDQAYDEVLSRVT